ncbi:MAG: redoxin domain-containing protein [Candidatus Eiseniibacteriota bacterium]
MQATAAPEVGQLAPDFKLKGPGGQPVTLSEYRGRNAVLLVFFPLAFSGICSHQLPSIEKLAPRFEGLNARILGISVDSHFANTEFASKLKLSFPLLSDWKREASTAYGVLIPDAGYSGRAVFIVDQQGRIAYRDLAVDHDDPAQVPSNERALEALKALA